MPCKLERCHPVVWLRIWGTNGQPMSSCLARHTKCATNRFNRSAWDQNIKPCKAEKKPRIYASKPHAAPVLSLCRPGVWRSLRGSSTKWGKNKRWDLHFKTISEEVYNICNLYSQFFTYMTYIEYNHRIMCIYIYNASGTSTLKAIWKFEHDWDELLHLGSGRDRSQCGALYLSETQKRRCGLNLSTETSYHESLR